MVGKRERKRADWVLMYDKLEAHSHEIESDPRGQILLRMYMHDRQFFLYGSSMSTATFRTRAAPTLPHGTYIVVVVGIPSIPSEVLRELDCGRGLSVVKIVLLEVSPEVSRMYLLSAEALIRD